jgi:hypothetical protein
MNIENDDCDDVDDTYGVVAQLVAHPVVSRVARVQVPSTPPTFLVERGIGPMPFDSAISLWLVRRPQFSHFVSLSGERFRGLAQW